MQLAQINFNPIQPPPSAVDPSATGIESLISTVIGFLTVAGGVLFLIWIAIGAYTWITAQGQPDKVEKARNHITQAVTGLIILVAAYAITALIGSLLGFDIFNPASLLGIS